MRLRQDDGGIWTNERRNRAGGGSWLRILAIGLFVGMCLPGFAGAAPTASDQNAGKIAPGQEILFALSYTGSPTSFTIVTSPAHGTLQSYNSRYGTTAWPMYYFYKADAGYEGGDSFTWKCADASGDSNVATCSVTVSSAPTANNQSVTVGIGGEVVVYLSYSDPTGSASPTFTISSGPSHGTLMTYLERYGYNYPSYYVYKPGAGYTGGDSFTWKMNNGYRDSNEATVSITVYTNRAPTAYSQTVNMSGGIRRSLSMSYSDPDTGQALTMTIVTLPSHGALEVSAGQPVSAGAGFPAAGTLYYTSQGGYLGTDSFTWKVSDGQAESATATCTMTYANATLTASGLSVGAAKNTPVTVQVLPAGLTGYGMGFANYAYPKHGSVGFSGTGFTYTPAAGYTGPDDFQYYITDGTVNSAAAYVSLMTKDATSDWPQFRCDEHRTGTTPMALTNSLYLQWRRDYPALTPSFAPDGNYDAGYEPVVLGKTMFVGSSRNDSVAALDTETGTNKWTFFTDGPIRVSPVAYSNRVFVSSDDGYFYCLNAADGSLVWKKSGGPVDGRRVYGDGRIISVWPCRGGPIVLDGKVYFTAGLWPHEGVFIYCLDAATGQVVWRNDSCHAIGAYEQHSDGSYVVTGFSPMGYMIVDNGQLGYRCLRIANGNCDAGSLKLDSGAYAAWGGHGGSKTSMNGFWPNWLASSYGPNYGWTDGFFTSRPVGITAGGKGWGPTEAAALGVSGTTYTLLAADGKLFVVTQQGSIYCFGPTQVGNPPVYPYTVTPLAAVNDGWKDLAAQILSQSAIGASGTGAALVWGIGSGRLVEELAKQSSLTVAVYDTDEAKVAALRTKLAAADYYGRRVAVHAADPMSVRFSPSLARLIVSEDLTAAGFAAGDTFVKKLNRTLRPNNGSAWLPTDAGQHSQFASWTNAAGVVNADLSRSTASGAAPACTVLKRLGLPKEIGQYMRPPWGVLYWGNTYSYSTFSGGAVQASGAGPGSNTHTNTMTGLVEGRSVYRGYGCAGSLDFWNLVVERSGCAAIYDYWTESGTFHLGGIRPMCSLNSGGSMWQMNDGTVLLDGPGCSCNYAFRATVAVTPMADEGVESYVAWSGPGRTTATIEEQPIQRVGVNFGGPGDWKDDEGTIWVPQPQRCMPSPELRGTFTGSLKVSTPHSSRFTAADKKTKLISSSCVKGISSYRIYLAGAPTALRASTAPTIDGSLADACWDGQKETELTAQQAYFASVWLRYDDANLYVAYRIAGDYRTSGEGFYLYLSDRQAAYSYSWDGPGSPRFSICADGSSSAPSGTVWTVARNVSSNEFTAEISISWNTVTNLLGFNKDQLVANFYGPGGTRIRMTQAAWPGIWPDGPTAPNRYSFTPLFLDSTGGAMGSTRPYRVRLYFAEPDDLAVGQRRFDVQLQGQTVLTDFDIAAAAGGANRAVVREFGVSVQDKLELTLVPKVGETLISGMEILPDTGPVAPAITSILAAAATVGQSFSYTITANGTSPITYGASGLPSGLTLSGAVISGTPTAAGTNSITLTASNGVGTDTKTLVLTVAPGVDAYGIPDSWKIKYFGSANAPGSGALEDPDGDGMSNLAEYVAGTDPSKREERFQVSDVRGDGTEFYLRFLTVAGRLYGVVRKDDLLSGSQWVILTNGMPGTGGYLEVRDPVTGAKRFYRITVRLQ